jgi:receptor-type tyrosine-protein phosphatase R
LNRAGVDKIDNYINANFVNGRDYIATQGPLSNTVDDFWLMVWEQEVSVVVMVTGIFEGDKQKCERYWPDSPSSRATTKDGILITMLSTDEHINDKPAAYVRSEFLLEHEGNSRIVHHFWYNTWPDMDVPIDANGEVQWQAASDMLSTISSEERKGPWVVHCSAGIGRTGTFIGIDMGQRRLKKEGKVDVLELIRTMRDDRSGMVQTEKQAEFMHRALVGYAEHHIRCS